MCQKFQNFEGCLNKDISHESQSNEKGHEELKTFVRVYNLFLFRNLFIFHLCSLHERIPFLLSILLTVNLTTVYQLPPSQALLPFLLISSALEKFFNVFNIRLAITWHDLLIFYKWIFFFCVASSNKEIPFHERTAMTTSLLSQKKRQTQKSFYVSKETIYKAGKPFASFDKLQIIENKFLCLLTKCMAEKQLKK